MAAAGRASQRQRLSLKTLKRPEEPETLKPPEELEELPVATI
jgi:hypothetical protein